MRLIDTYKIPTYAVCALEYGDDSGLEDEDIANIDEWLVWLGEDNLFFDWSNGIDNEPSFTSNPAFGLPMDCIDCKVYTHND